MIRGLTSAARGMIQLSIRHDVIAHNLANAATPGFKSRRAATHDFSTALGSQLSAARATAQPNDRIPGLSAQVADPKVVTRRFDAQGSTLTTETKTDFAIEGPGFFVVEGDGAQRLTRNGSFLLNGAGELVTSSSERVQGSMGSIRVNSDDWSIDSSGQVYVEGAVVDRLKMVMTTSNGGSVDVPDGDRRVIQGAIESSNVGAVREMVATIANMRAFEANQKAIQSIDQTLDKLINEAARV